MRKFFENAISLLVAAVSLILCWKWYSATKEIEPIVGMVAAGGVLLTGLACRLFPEKPELSGGQNTVDNSKNTVANANISAGGNVHVGDKTSINNEGSTIQNQFNGGTFNNPNFH